MTNMNIARRILNELGLSVRHLGYSYILYASNLIAEDESILLQTTKVLYIEIAKAYSVTPLSVERSIRYSIDFVWKHADKHTDLITKAFGYNYLNKKPSNKVFLELLHNYIKTLEPNTLHISSNLCPLYGCECHLILSSIYK